MVIRIKDLPLNNSPTPTQFVATDLSAMQRLSIQSLVDTGAPIASQAEAEAGTQATKRMTPLTTAQAIAVQAATAAEGALAASAVQPGDLATVAFSGDYNDLIDKPTFSSSLIFPVKADAAAATIPTSEAALRINGSLTVGDGLGGMYIDTNNGNPDTFVSSGGTARTWYRAPDVSASRLVGSPGSYGAVGDGNSHPLSDYFASLAAAQVFYPHAVALTDQIDWAAFQGAANAGAQLSLTGGKTYRFNRQLLVTTNGFTIDGDGTCTILPDMTYFTNNTKAGELGATGCIILCRGLLSGAFTPLVDVRISGFKMDGQSVDNRRTILIGGQNIKDWTVSDIEAYNFAVGAMVYGDRIFGNSKMTRNHMHDWFSNVAYADAVTAQASGFHWDDNPVNGLRSDGVEFSYNRFEDIVKGAVAIAANGIQTDGVNINSFAGKNHKIFGNYGRNVDELIDVFGQYCEVYANVGEDVGMLVKLIHGASYNHVHHNRGNAVTRSHIGVYNANNGADTANNLIEDNYLSGITSNADARACIDLDDPTTGFKVSGNRFKNNYLDPQPGGQACIRSTLKQGENYSSGDTFVAPGSVGYVTSADATANNLLVISNADPLPLARMTMGANQVITATETKVLFNTPTFNRGITADGTNSRITIRVPGWYRFRGQIRSSSVPTSNEGTLRLRKNGSTDFGTEAVYFASGNPQTMMVEAIAQFVEGDYIEVFTLWTTAPSFTITSLSTFTLFTGEMV